MTNEDVLKKGFEKGYKQIVAYLYNQMYMQCERLLVEVPKHRQFLGFTGNTQTSYSCGIYIDGRLEGIVAQRNWNAPPIHAKVRKGEWVYLGSPYEGVPRSVKGKVDVGDSFGQTTSFKFLQSYPARKGHVQIVMTTGTEYSEYLETVAHLDVLSGTYESAKLILARGFRPMQ